MRFLSVFFIVVSISFPSFAERFEYNSQVSSVLLTSDGALIERNIQVSVPSGNHEIVLSDMPLPSIPLGLSLRVPDGADLIVNSLGVSPNPASDLKPIETEAMRIQSQKVQSAQQELNVSLSRQSEMQGRLNAAEAKAALIQNISSGTVALPEKSDTFALGDLIADMDTFMKDATEQAAKARADLSLLNSELAELTEKLAYLIKGLEDLEVEASETVSLVLNVNSSAGFEGTIGISYVDENASWNVVSDIHVTQNKDRGTIRVDRYAVVTQRTGGDWQNVDLTLSTASFDEDMEFDLPWVRTYRLDEKLKLSGSLSREMSEDGILSEPVITEVEEPSFNGASVSNYGQTLTYKPEGQHTILHNSASIISLGPIEFDVMLEAHFGPMSDTATLVAEIENTTGGRIIGGEASLYRDGLLLGSTELPDLVHGEKSNLSLGPLDGILVETRNLSSSDGDRGLFGGDQGRAERFEIEITSELDYAISAAFFAGVPLSKNDELVITAQNDPAPNTSAHNRIQGLQRWDLEIAPGSVSKIKFGYDMRWPKDKELR